MGLSFAKSINFGPVRFNISGGGIGMSVGVPGLRIGTGPRGAYIAGGIAGFRYRQSLASGRQPAVAPAPIGQTQGRRFEPGFESAPQPNVYATVEHETKSILELTDATSDSLIQSMNEQRKKLTLWPFVGACLVLLLLALGSVKTGWPAFVLPILTGLSIALVGGLYWRDSVRKLTVLFFEPDTEATAQFEAISRGAQAASSARRIQAIVTTSQYSDTKYSAGASRGFKLTKANCTTGQAPGVAANVDVPILLAAKTTLAFYPDRILAFQGSSVGAIEYTELNAVASPSSFVESGSVPSDATVTGHTWQYVNKSGGPDRRFKNNRQMPICRYAKLHLSTNRGLDVHLMSSLDGGFDELVKVLRERRFNVKKPG